jgi:antitoxin Phd
MEATCRTYFELDKLHKMSKIANMSADPATSDVGLATLKKLPAMSASSLKNHIGEALLKAAGNGLAITRHNRPEFVLLPAAKYLELQRAHQMPLEALSAEFDAMVARMNTPSAQRGVNSLFSATPTELGKSAVKAAAAQGQ